jgi:hypothetical protein
MAELPQFIQCQRQMFRSFDVCRPVDVQPRNGIRSPCADLTSAPGSWLEPWAPHHAHPGKWLLGPVRGAMFISPVLDHIELGAEDGYQLTSVGSRRT